VNRLDYKPFYERHLPHYQPPGATLFITFRLVDSIPASVQQQLWTEADRVEAMLACLPDPQERTRRAYQEQRRLFGKWDTAMDSATTGPFWLRIPQIAEWVVGCIHYPDNEMYELDAFCVMPNHVHVLLTPLLKDKDTYYSIAAIMHSVKGNSARKANPHLGRRGQFWQHENYDHVVRDETEWKRIVTYIWNNPVKAGLVKRAEDWPWTYCKYPEEQAKSVTRSTSY
jgi:REP element-mobilizing transposase RayT